MLPVAIPITDVPVTLPTTELFVLILICLYMVVFLIEKIFKVIKYFKESSNRADEMKAKTLSRDYLLQTRDDVACIKSDCKEMRKIITKEHDGSYLIYNKGLEKYVEILNNNIINLTDAIKNLAK